MKCDACEREPYGDKERCQWCGHKRGKRDAAWNMFHIHETYSWYNETWRQRFEEIKRLKAAEFEAIKNRRPFPPRSQWPSYRDSDVETATCSESLAKTVVNEKPCGICGRNNDVGVPVCWHCGEEIK